MQRYADYTDYLNSKKYKQIACDICPPDNGGGGGGGGGGADCPCPVTFDVYYNDKTPAGDTVVITIQNEVTYINEPLDGNNADNKLPQFYLLQNDSSIPNATKKQIVCNLNLPNMGGVRITCENPAGYIVNGKRATSYDFAFKGESLELLWNSFLDGWSVTSHAGRFNAT